MIWTLAEHGLPECLVRTWTREPVLPTFAGSATPVQIQGFSRYILHRAQRELVSRPFACGGTRCDLTRWCSALSVARNASWSTEETTSWRRTSPPLASWPCNLVRTNSGKWLATKSAAPSPPCPSKTPYSPASFIVCAVQRSSFGGLSPVDLRGGFDEPVAAPKQYGSRAIPDQQPKSPPNLANPHSHLANPDPRLSTTPGLGQAHHISAGSCRSLASRDRRGRSAHTRARASRTARGCICALARGACARARSSRKSNSILCSQNNRKFTSNTNTDSGKILKSTTSTEKLTTGEALPRRTCCVRTVLYMYCSNSNGITGEVARSIIEITRSSVILILHVETYM